MQQSVFPESHWFQRNPLLPWAGAAALGIVLERRSPLSLELLLFATPFFLLLSASAFRKGNFWFAWCFGLVVCALGFSGWHRWQAYLPANSIAHLATVDGTPCRVRGTVLQGPDVIRIKDAVLYSLNQDARRCNLTLDVHSLDTVDGERAVSGLVYVHINEELRDIAPGDGIELLGLLKEPAAVMNPGGPDPSRAWLDDGKVAILLVKTAGGVMKKPEAARWSFRAMMALLRGKVEKALASVIGSGQQGVAVALITGSTSMLEPAQFEGYQKTGVYHVLAVSGQHLVILCSCLTLLFRFFDVSALRRFLMLGSFVTLYMLFTGAHPPVVRAAIMVLLFLLAPVVGRRNRPVNTLATAALLILFLKPSALVNVGCQLSFLATWVLIQLIPQIYIWRQERMDVFDQLRARLRSGWSQLLHRVLEILGWSILASAVVWLAIAPLVAWQYHIVSPMAILLGPVISLFASISLLCGFLILPFSLLQLGAPFGSLTEWSLTVCDNLVSTTQAIPGSHFWVADVPTISLILFYAMVIPILIAPRLLGYWKSAGALLLVWSLVTYLAMRPERLDGVRVTVLAIGHGNAAVVETPDGRVLLFDIGTTAGPHSILRHVSHYLWYRGRTHVDDLFLSHADLDHFNGLPALLERFQVSRIHMTPTFQEKPSGAVSLTMKRIRQHGCIVDILSQGMQLLSDDVTLTVLHPPADGKPAGTENARSMVVLLQYVGSSLLITGDIEGPGLAMLTGQTISPVDVLIAPHHGSPSSNTLLFASWCRPKLVISSESPPPGKRPDPYSPLPATLWRTGLHGGVTIHFGKESVEAETSWSRLKLKVK